MGDKYPYSADTWKRPVDLRAYLIAQHGGNIANGSCTLRAAKQAYEMIGVLKRLTGKPRWQLEAEIVREYSTRHDLEDIDLETFCKL